MGIYKMFLEAALRGDEKNSNAYLQYFDQIAKCKQAGHNIDLQSTPILEGGGHSKKYKGRIPIIACCRTCNHDAWTLVGMR